MVQAGSRIISCDRTTISLRRASEDQDDKVSPTSAILRSDLVIVEGHIRLSQLSTCRKNRPSYARAAIRINHGSARVERRIS